MFALNCNKSFGVEESLLFVETRFETRFVDDMRSSLYLVAMLSELMGLVM